MYDPTDYSKIIYSQITALLLAQQLLQMGDQTASVQDDSTKL